MKIPIAKVKYVHAIDAQRERQETLADSIGTARTNDVSMTYAEMETITTLAKGIRTATVAVVIGENVCQRLDPVVFVMKTLTANQTNAC